MIVSHPAQSQTVTAPPAGTSALAVPQALRARVESAWYGAPSAQAAQEILPDGCIDAVLAFNSDGLDVAIYGSTTRATVIPVRGNSHYLGFRFRPGCWTAQGYEASALIDGMLPLQARVPALAGMGSPEPQALMALLAQALRDLREPAPDKLVQAAVERVRASQGELRIAGLARDCGVSRRMLERRFSSAVGLTPKFYAEIVQMQAAIRRLGTTPRGSLAALAVDCGYADHSHMTRQLRRLAGRTPSEFLP